jgi:hypothetical protein
MRNPDRPKLSERQQLARRRRRALSVSSSILAATLFGSWISLHAWSEDALPGWLRAPSDAMAALAALLPGASAEATTPEAGKRRATAPAGVAVPQVVAKAARVHPIASATDGAQEPVLDGAGGDSNASQGTTNTEATVSVDVGANAQPSPPLQPVEPTEPVPGVELPTPGDVAPILDAVGDTVGDVVGTLLPDDFSLDLSPRVGNDTVGAGANVDVNPSESSVQTQVGLEMDTPVAPVDVDAKVALEPQATQVDVGALTALGSATVSVNPASEVLVQGGLAGKLGLAASVPVSGSAASVAVGVDLLGIQIDEPVHIGGDGKGGPLIELPNLGIGLPGAQ